MSNTQFKLFAKRRFFPLFIVQFFGAFNDNLAKTAFTVLIAYGLWDLEGFDPVTLVSAAAAIFILPFVLFCPFAGALADVIDKAAIIRWNKLMECFIALAAAAVFLSGALYPAFIVLFALGVQSAFFSPCKFSILPQHLASNELIAGNALVSMGTYVAILGGTILGAYLAPMEDGKTYVAICLGMFALIGYVTARFVPAAPPEKPLKTGMALLFITSYISMFTSALMQKKGVIIAILGTAWFYFFAAMLHAQFPNFTAKALGADNSVLIALMAFFTAGVAVGGLANNRILKSKIDTRFVPWAALLMAAFGIDASLASWAFEAPEGGALYDFWAFAAQPGAGRIMLDFFMLSVACGIYVVPLRAFVQEHTALSKRARVVSFSNVMDAVFILASAVFAIALLSFGFDVVGLYLFAALATLGVGGCLFMTSSLRDTSCDEGRPV